MSINDEAKVLTHENGNNYKLDPDGATIRITVGSVTVHIVPGSETVSVELYPLGHEEDHHIIESASVSYAEAKEIVRDIDGGEEAEGPCQG